jgi:sodium transport system ATP-binding protein
MLDMAPLLDRRTDGFSQGERMKTALARALVHDPPTSSWTSPPTAWTCWPRARCATRCAACATRQGKCIVFSTHIMQEVERLCDQVVVVAHGRTVAEGTVAALLARTGETTSRRPS